MRSSNSIPLYLETYMYMWHRIKNHRIVPWTFSQIILVSYKCLEALQISFIKKLILCTSHYQPTAYGNQLDSVWIREFISQRFQIYLSLSCTPSLLCIPFRFFQDWEEICPACLPQLAWSTAGSSLSGGRTIACEVWHSPSVSTHLCSMLYLQCTVLYHNSLSLLVWSQYWPGECFTKT